MLESNLYDLLQVLKCLYMNQCLHLQNRFRYTRHCVSFIETVHHVCRVVLFCELLLHRHAETWLVKEGQKLLSPNVLITFLNEIAYLTTGTKVIAGLCKS